MLSIKHYETEEIKDLHNIIYIGDSYDNKSFINQEIDKDYFVKYVYPYKSFLLKINLPFKTLLKNISGYTLFYVMRFAIITFNNFAIVDSDEDFIIILPACIINNIYGVCKYIIMKEFDHGGYYCYQCLLEDLIKEHYDGEDLVTECREFHESELSKSGDDIEVDGYILKKIVFYGVDIWRDIKNPLKYKKILKYYKTKYRHRTVNHDDVFRDFAFDPDHSDIVLFKNPNRSGYYYQLN